MITSFHNARIQSVRALLGRRKEREELKAFVVEGVRLAEEALMAGWLPQWMLVSETLSERGRKVANAYAARGIEVETVSSHLMESISDTETSQGLMAVFSNRDLPLPDRPNFLLVVDEVRDPGNLGTLLRSAAAAGVQAALVSPGTADVFSAKVLRAGMGAQFHLPVRTMTWDQVRTYCKKSIAPVSLYLAEAGQGTPLWQVDLRQPVALVVGGEAEGASLQARQMIDGLITIPMPGQGESLNAAVAASILLFEVVRQRSL
ncbi:MAG TPA: RNA methyltransferase [Anaerolineaceae bacterium]|nr:RNA methyltransferase [Anaerolineaceae bacterium]